MRYDFEHNFQRNQMRTEDLKRQGNWRERCYPLWVLNGLEYTVPTGKWTYINIIRTYIYHMIHTHIYIYSIDGNWEKSEPLGLGFLVPTKVGCCQMSLVVIFFHVPHSYAPQTHSIIQYESTSASNPKNKRNRDILNVSASLLRKHWKGPCIPYFPNSKVADNAERIPTHGSWGRSFDLGPGSSTPRVGCSWAWASSTISVSHCSACATRRARTSPPDPWQPQLAIQNGEVAASDSKKFRTVRQLQSQAAYL